jgi:hypothetical protein
VPTIVDPGAPVQRAHPLAGQGLRQSHPLAGGVARVSAGVAFSGRRACHVDICWSRSSKGRPSGVSGARSCRGLMIWFAFGGDRRVGDRLVRPTVGVRVGPPESFWWPGGNRDWAALRSAQRLADRGHRQHIVVVGGLQRGLGWWDEVTFRFTCSPLPEWVVERVAPPKTTTPTMTGRVGAKPRCS